MAEAISVVEFGGRRLAITLAVMCAALLETLDSTIVNVALPVIEGNLGASIDEGIWIITAYITANVISIPLNPFLTRFFGRKRYFAGCIIGFTVASVLCGTAGSLPALVAFRFLQGAFGGGLIATSQVVMRETFPPHLLGASSGLFAVALITGPALGPLFGGYLTDHASWRWIFDVNVLPGAFSAGVILALLRDPVGPTRVSIDWIGVGSLALGLSTLQFVLDNGATHDWFADPKLKLAACVGAVSIAFFIIWELFYARDPVVDLRVFGLRGVAVGAPLAFAFGVVIFIPAVIMPLFGDNVLGFPASLSGLLLVGRAVPVVLLTPLFATLAQNGSDVRYFLATGFILTAASLTWLSQVMTAGTSFDALIVPLVVSGIGQSMLLVPLIVGVLSTTPAALNGRISPIITLFVQLGGTIATAVSIAYFDGRIAMHDQHIRETITLGRPVIAHAASIAQNMQMLASMVFQQAAVRAFADTIAVTAGAALLVIIAVPFFPRSRAMENAGE